MMKYSATLSLSCFDFIVFHIKWNHLEPVFYEWLSKVTANKRRRYISSFFSRWLRHCSTIDRKQAHWYIDQYSITVRNFFIPNHAKSRSLVTYLLIFQSFWNFGQSRAVILQHKIAKRLNNGNWCHGRTKFHVLWVWDEFRTDILYCKSPKPHTCMLESGFGTGLTQLHYMRFYFQINLTDDHSALVNVKQIIKVNNQFFETYPRASIFNISGVWHPGTFKGNPEGTKCLFY